MRSLLVSGLVATLALTNVAGANVVTSFYNNSGSYHWKCYHMPDFDQRRDNCCGHPGLPGDGGMYCVPTSAMNLFAYAGNHGYPFLDPGQGNWQSQSHYDEITGRLTELGLLMSCDAANGTGGTGWSTGGFFWTAAYGLGLLTTQNYYLSSSYTPRAYKIGKKAVQGSIIEFVYGRYDVVGEFGGDPVLDRTGGHAVTLTDIWNLGSGTTIRYRDPASDAANTSQSTFVNKEVNAVAITVRFLDDILSPRTVTAISYPSDDGKVRIIDGFMALKPIFCLSFVNNDGLTLQKVAPVALEGQGTNPVKLETGFAIEDLCLDADGDDAIAIVNIGAAAAVFQLQRIDLDTGEQVPLGIPGLKRCCVGRNGDIYAHDGGKLYRFDPEGNIMGATSSIPTPTALAFDDKNDHVLLLSVPQKKLARFDQNLELVSTFNVPTNIPMSGDGSVIVNPLDDKVYFCSDGANAIYDVAGVGPIFAFDTVNISPAVMAPKGIGVSDNGKLFVSSQGFLKVLQHTTDRDSRSAWNYDTTSPFFNSLVGGRVSMLTSRTNVDPAIHDTPKWNNIDPDLLLDIGVEVPDCLGDLNLDSKIDAADLGQLLGAWNTADGEADLNADGIVNATDLGIMLGLWGNCP